MYPTENIIVAIIAAGLGFWLFKNKITPSQSDEKLQLKNKTCIWSQKEIIVILNPFGGGGKSKKLWETIVKNSFLELQIKFHVIFTERAGHAYDLLKSDLEISKYAGLVVISGDGMLHEILNGILARAGKNIARVGEISEQLPILIIPGGTMNGYAASLGYFTVTDALLRLSTCTSPKSMDAYSVHLLKNDQLLLDLHQISAGIVADHDELVERKLRFLPTFLRLLAAPAIVIGKKKAYRGVVSFLPSENQKANGISDITKVADSQQKPGWKSIDDEFVMLTVINTSHAAFDMIFVPSALPNDGSLYLIVVRKEVSRFRMIQIFLGFETGKHIEFPDIEIYKVDKVEYRPQTPGVIGISGETLPFGPTDVKIEPKLLKFIY